MLQTIDAVSAKIKDVEKSCKEHTRERLETMSADVIAYMQSALDPINDSVARLEVRLGNVESTMREAKASVALITKMADEFAELVQRVIMKSR